YCQSYLYAQYMIQRGGTASLGKMLDAYRANASTTEAVRQTFNIDLAAFEQGYRDYVVQWLAEDPFEPRRSLAELKKRLEARPDDPTCAGEYAWGLLEAGNQADAESLAEKTAARNPKERWSAMVLARREAEREEWPAA